MNWQCMQCEEANERQFSACWNCGASRDGQADPEFRSQVEPDPVEVNPVWTPPQFGLAQVMLYVALVAAVVFIGRQLGVWPAFAAILALLVLAFTEDRTRQLDSATRARILGLEIVATVFLIYRAAK